MIRGALSDRNFALNLLEHKSVRRGERASESHCSNESIGRRQRSIEVGSSNDKESAKVKVIVKFVLVGLSERKSKKRTPCWSFYTSVKLRRRVCLLVLISTWTAFQVVGLLSLLSFVLILKRGSAFQEAQDRIKPKA